MICLPRRNFPPQNACVACKAKKRSCDRGWPACSRCKRLSQICQYHDTREQGSQYPALWGNSCLIGSHQSQIAPLDVSYVLNPGACLRCKTARRQCSRELPMCSRCVRMGVWCRYYDKGGPSQLSTETELVGSDGRQDPIPACPSTTTRYPVPAKAHFSTLMAHRKAAVVNLAYLYPKTMAYRIQTSWLDTAIKDPCLFHAVLFGTSSSIDITQGAPASSITLYHKTQIIRLIQRAITECNYKDIPASAVAATLYLLYHTRLNGDLTEAKAHETGMDAILRHCRYETPDPNTFLGYLLISRYIWNALIARLETVYTQPHAGPVGYIGNYTNLLSIAVQKQMERPTHSRLPSPTLSFICMIEKVFMTDPSRNGQVIEMSQITSLAPGSSTPSIAQKCCMLAADIYWKAIMNRKVPCRARSNQESQEDILCLKNAVMSSDEEFWFMHGPEVFRWVLLTGAAAASSSSLRAWFIVRSFSFCAVVEPQEVDTFVAATDHLVWLFNRR